MSMQVYLFYFGSVDVRVKQTNNQRTHTDTLNSFPTGTAGPEQGSRAELAPMIILLLFSPPNIFTFLHF